MDVKKEFPKAKKRIDMFLQSEEGKITREQAITTATTMLLTASFFAARTATGKERAADRKAALKHKLDRRKVGLHGSHSSHGSHCSHGSHASHGSHGSHGSHSSHGSHASHGSHGSHGSHSSHGSHASHGSHSSHGSHGSHGSW